MNEADPISRRSDFCAMLLARSYWDGNVSEGKQGLPDVMGSDVACCAIPSVKDTVHDDNLLNEIQQSYTNDHIFRQPEGCSALRNTKYYFHKSTGIWTCVGTIYVPKGGEIKRRIIYECHDASVSGHPPISRTIASVLSKFYFPEVKPFLKNYIDNCIVCKRAKMILQKKA